MPVVIGAAQYPEHIIETLEQTHKVYTINATEEAKKLGNPRVFNMIVLGMASRHMDFSRDQWYQVIEKAVPPKTIEIRKEAELMGDVRRAGFVNVAKCVEEGAGEDETDIRICRKQTGKSDGGHIKACGGGDQYPGRFFL